MNLLDNNNDSTIHLYFSSNNNHLCISIFCKDTVEYFSTSFSKENLLQIHKEFTIFTNVNNIYNELIKFTKSNINKITVQKSFDNIELKIKDFFQEEEIIFILLRCSFQKEILYLQNNNTLSFKNNSITKKCSFFNTIYNKFTNKFCSLNIEYKIFLVRNILSFILLFSLCIILYLKYLNPISSYIVSKEDVMEISNWINHQKLLKYSLLYRASRDGDSSSTFHKICDGKGPTLTLISTKEGFKFGGYTSGNWSSYGDYYGQCDDVFLFSLTLHKKYYPKNENNKVICCKGNTGPCFGYGHDLFINDHCFKEKSSCYSPSSFIGMDEANEFNGGNKKFIVREIEVYLVEIVNK